MRRSGGRSDPGRTASRRRSNQRQRRQDRVDLDRQPQPRPDRQDEPQQPAEDDDHPDEGGRAAAGSGHRRDDTSGHESQVEQTGGRGRTTAGPPGEEQRHQTPEPERAQQEPLAGELVEAVLRGFAGDQLQVEPMVKTTGNAQVKRPVATSTVRRSLVGRRTGVEATGTEMSVENTGGSSRIGLTLPRRSRAQRPDHIAVLS